MNFIKEDMKSFDLSQDQKYKLLEMCEKLFPKHNFEIIDSSGGDHRNSVFCLRIEDGDVPLLDVSWFEFCITHLCTTIGNSESTSDNFDETTLRGDMYFTMEWGRNNHPVDYLYEEFKKLT